MVSGMDANFDKIAPGLSMVVQNRYNVDVVFIKAKSGALQWSALLHHGWRVLLDEGDQLLAILN